MHLPGIGPGESDPQVGEQVEIQAKYSGYIERQREEIERQRRQEHLALPALDYARCGLSWQVREKLGATTAPNSGPSQPYSRHDSRRRFPVVGASQALPIWHYLG